MIRGLVSWILLEVLYLNWIYSLKGSRGELSQQGDKKSETLWQPLRVQLSSCVLSQRNPGFSRARSPTFSSAHTFVHAPCIIIGASDSSTYGRHDFLFSPKSLSHVCAFGLACAAAGINSESSAQSVIFHAALFLYCCKFAAIESEMLPPAPAKRNLMEKMLSLRRR